MQSYRIARTTTQEDNENTREAMRHVGDQGKLWAIRLAHHSGSFEDMIQSLG